MKYLIVRRNGLGDFISATIPLCKYIRKKDLEAEIFVFLSERNKEVSKYFTGFRYFVIPDGNKYLAAVKTGVRSRTENFDVGVATVPGSLNVDGVFLYASGARERVGHSADGWGNCFFTQLKKFKYHDHVALQNIRLLDESVEEIPEFCYPSFNKNYIKEIDVSLDDKGLLVELSNNRVTSQLSLDNLVYILNEVYKVIPFELIVTLKKEDYVKGMLLKKRVNMKVQVVVTPTFDDFVALVNKADYFLLGDGGASHIAGALGKAGVALYGGISVGRWGVLSKCVSHLYHDKDVNCINVKSIIDEILSVMTKV